MEDTIFTHLKSFTPLIRVLSLCALTLTPALAAALTPADLGTLCENGDPKACVTLGNAYKDGDGIEPDLRKAFHYQEMACDLDFGMGCHNASLLLRNSSDEVEGPDRLGRAATLSRRGCELEYLDACNNLAYAVATGRGIRKDYKTARGLFAWTCARDSALGCRNLGHFMRLGKGGPRDREWARELFAKACALGDEDACRL